MPCRAECPKPKYALWQSETSLPIPYPRGRARVSPSGFSTGTRSRVMKKLLVLPPTFSDMGSEQASLTLDHLVQRNW